MKTMQKPISRLLALCASLQATCLCNSKDENASANELLALPRVRLAAIVSAIDNVVLSSVGQLRAMHHHAAAQKGAHDLLARFDRCSERALGVPVGRAQAIALLSDAVAAATMIAESASKLDGACSEIAEMFR